MTDGSASNARRRRRRATARQGPPAPRSAVPAVPDAGAAEVAAELSAAPASKPERELRPTRRPAAARRFRGERDSGEGALRDLIGAGPSQLGVGGAMRGRDVNRPTDADLEQAERDVVIVRRNWKPPT